MATYFKSDNKLTIPAYNDFVDVTVATTGAVTTFYSTPGSKFTFFQLLQARMPVGSKNCIVNAMTRGRAFTGGQDTIKNLLTQALGPSFSNFNAQSVTYKNIPQLDPFYYLKELDALLTQADINAKCALLGPGDIVTAQIQAFGGSDTLNLSYRIFEFDIN